MPTTVILSPVDCAWCRRPIPGQVSEVKGSHGICVKCIRKHFPELDLDSGSENPDTTSTPDTKGTAA